MFLRHYDAIILGRSTACLASAALLAKCDLRVLVLGQGAFPSGYRYENFKLKRRSPPLLFGHTPAFRNILQDLGQSQRFRQKVKALDPMFSVLSDQYRLEFPPHPDPFAKEIDREFPEVRQLIEEFYARIAGANAALDRIIDHDAIWPPAKFLERLELQRLSYGIPLSEAGADPLAKFPPQHPFRKVATIPTDFASDLDPAVMKLPALAFARLHGSWTRGLQYLPEGEEQLENFFCDRITDAGGVVRLDSKVSQIHLKRGKISGVSEDGEEALTGTSSLITSLSGEALAVLTGGVGLRRAAEDQWPQLTPSCGRFVTSIIVKADGVPQAMPHESFVIPSARLDPRRSPILRVQRLATDDPSHELLVCEMRFEVDGALTLFEAREATLKTLASQIPFIRTKLVIVDSVHDGLPLWDFRGTSRKEIERVNLQGTQTTPEVMAFQWALDRPGFLGLCGEPVRGPIAGSFLVGPTVIPGLGQEGELIAARSAARLLATKLGIRTGSLAKRRTLFGSRNER